MCPRSLVYLLIGTRYIKRASQVEINLPGNFVNIDSDSKGIMLGIHLGVHRVVGGGGLKYVLPLL